MSQGQTGLRKNFRITDHIYTLFILIKIYIKIYIYIFKRVYQEGPIFLHLLCTFSKFVWFCFERRFDAQIRKKRDYRKVSECRKCYVHVTFCFFDV